MRISAHASDASGYWLSGGLGSESARSPTQNVALLCSTKSEVFRVLSPAVRTGHLTKGTQ